MSFGVWSKRASGFLTIADRRRNVSHETAMKKTQVFFWVGEFGEGGKIFPMNRGPEDHLPPTSMKFSLIS
jgi:hypothetical protein